MINPNSKVVKSMAMWNPWRGCHKYSEGCKYCYIHKSDAKRGIDTNAVVKTGSFYAPVAKNAKGVHFDFRKCGTLFIKDGKAYKLNVRDLCRYAKKANIDC